MTNKDKRIDAVVLEVALIRNESPTALRQAYYGTVRGIAATQDHCRRRSVLITNASRADVHVDSLCEVIDKLVPKYDR